MDDHFIHVVSPSDGDGLVRTMLSLDGEICQTRQIQNCKGDLHCIAAIGGKTYMQQGGQFLTCLDWNGNQTHLLGPQIRQIHALATSDDRLFVQEGSKIKIY